jgi:biopolymer transport protein ExbD
VWVHTGALQAQQPHGPSESVAPVTEQLKITVGLGEWSVGVTEADRQMVAAGPQQLANLRTVLAQYHHAHPGERDVVVQPDSAVNYQSIIGVMDVVYDVWSTGAPAGAHLHDSVRLQLM